MKHNGKDSVKKLVKSTLERYSSGNVNAQTLKNILGAKGYTVIRYSALDVSEETERLMSTLGVTEISRQTDSFTYLDNVRRIVFIRKDISDDEFLYLLALELGRILTTSFRGSCIVSGNSQDEAEAREFAYHVTDIARHGIFYNMSKFYPIQTVIVSAVLASFIIVFACVSLALPGLYGKNALQNDTNQELAVSAISRGVEDSSKPNQQAEDLSAPENPTADGNSSEYKNNPDSVNSNIITSDANNSDGNNMDGNNLDGNNSGGNNSAGVNSQQNVNPADNQNLSETAGNSGGVENSTESVENTETSVTGTQQTVDENSASQQSFVVPEEQRVYYATPNGTKYHLPGCGYIKGKEVKELSYDDIAGGKYTPCSRCFG